MSSSPTLNPSSPSAPIYFLALPPSSGKRYKILNPKEKQQIQTKMQDLQTRIGRNSKDISSQLNLAQNENQLLGSDYESLRQAGVGNKRKIQDLSEQLTESEAKRQKIETELKESEQKKKRPEQANFALTMELDVQAARLDAAYKLIEEQKKQLEQVKTN